MTHRLDKAEQPAWGDGAPMGAQYPKLAGHFIATVPFTICASTLCNTFHWEDQNYPKSPTSWSHSIFALLGLCALLQWQLLIPKTPLHVAAAVCRLIVYLIVCQKAITRGMGSHRSPCVGGQRHLHYMRAQWPPPPPTCPKGREHAKNYFHSPT